MGPPPLEPCFPSRVIWRCKVSIGLAGGVVMRVAVLSQRRFCPNRLARQVHQSTKICTKICGNLGILWNPGLLFGVCFWQGPLSLATVAEEICFRDLGSWRPWQSGRGARTSTLPGGLGDHKVWFRRREFAWCLDHASVDTFPGTRGRDAR